MASFTPFKPQSLAKPAGILSRSKLFQAVRSSKSNKKVPLFPITRVFSEVLKTQTFCAGTGSAIFGFLNAPFGLKKGTSGFRLTFQGYFIVTFVSPGSVFLQFSFLGTVGCY